MTWPISQDYNEAIQSPETSFADPELKKGEVVCNALGIPLPRSGNFADVYEFRCTNGTRWAIKCFTREVAGLRERYQEISRALQDAKLPFTVEFTYQQEGIRIRGKWYPILKMQWVEGLTFNDFVRQNLDKPAILEGTMQIWGRMSQRLRAAGIAHADLQHGNVLLVPGSTAGSLAVKLIDYDGMFVPSLTGKPSGEVGHPSYQHPQRLKEGIYSAEVDRFPLLLIATALRCLRAGGRALWERHDNGDNLLFREADLKAPDTSKLFAELDGLSDAKAKKLVGLVRKALTGSLDSVPHLDEVLPDLASQATTTTKPSRPAAAVPTTAAPARAQTAAIQTAADVATDADGADSLDFDKPARRGTRRGKKSASSSNLWLLVGGAAAVGLLVIVGGAIGAIALFAGKSNPSAPDKTQQASVRPQSKEKDAPANPTDNKKLPADKPPADKPPPDKPPADKLPADKPPADKPTPDVKGPPKIYDKDPRFSLLDLHDQANMDLTKGIDYEENTLEEVPLGVQLLADVPFWIQNRYLYFDEGHRKFEQIGVGGKFKKLHVLHGAHWSDGKEAEDIISRYEIHYIDGTSDSIPVCYIRDVLDFWHAERSKTAKVAWSGSNKVAARQRCKISLFLSTYDNPHPEKTVQTIDYVRVNGGRLATFCVAMSVEVGEGETGFMINPDTAEPGLKDGLVFRLRSVLNAIETTKAPIKGVAISANGKVMMTTTGVDGYIYVGYLDKGGSGKRMETPYTSVSGMAFMPGNKSILFGADDGKLHQWDVEKHLNGEMASFDIGLKKPLTSLVVSTDGKLALAGSEEGMRVFNLVTRKLVPGKWTTEGGVDDLSITDNGKLVVASLSEGICKGWNPETGTMEMALGTPGDNLRTGCAISPDGKFGVSSAANGNLTLQDPMNKRYGYATIGKVIGPITALTISVDGRFVAAMCDGSRSLVVYDTSSCKEIVRAVAGADGFVPGQMKFATASTTLLAAGADGKLFVFDYAKRVPGIKYSNQDPVVRNPDPVPDPPADPGAKPTVRNFMMSKDGEVITYGSTGVFCPWAFAEGRLTTGVSYKGPNVPTQFFAAGHRVVVTTSMQGLMHTLNLNTGACERLTNLEAKAIHALDVSADDSIVVVSCNINDEPATIAIDLKDGKELGRIPRSVPRNGICFVKDGMFLLAGITNKRLDLWDPRSDKKVTLGLLANEGFHDISVSRDGRLASVVDGSAVRTFEVDGGKEVSRLQSLSKIPVTSVSISPSGKVGVATRLDNEVTSFQIFTPRNGVITRDLDQLENTLWIRSMMVDDEHMLLLSKGGTRFHLANVPRPKAADPTADSVPKTGPWQVLADNFDPVESDMVPEGGLLIGLEFGTDKFAKPDDCIRACRLIYQNANGDEVKGKQYGTTLKKVITVKAKPGYAVGGVVGKAGIGWDGAKVVFMKLGPDGKLDPADSYESEWIGGRGGKAETLLGGDGTTISGIRCKVTKKDVTGFGLIPKP